MQPSSTGDPGSPERPDRRGAIRRVLAALGAGIAIGVLYGVVAQGAVVLILRERGPDEGPTSGVGFGLDAAGPDDWIVSMLGGAATGIALVAILSVVRLSLPSAARVPAAVLLGATFGGNAFLDPPGEHILLREPAWLAVVVVVAVSALTAGSIAILLERAARVHPWPTAWLRTPPRRVVVTARVVASAFVALLVAAQGTELIDVVGTFV